MQLVVTFSDEPINHIQCNTDFCWQHIHQQKDSTDAANKDTTIESGYKDTIS